MIPMIPEENKEIKEINENKEIKENTESHETAEAAETAEKVEKKDRGMLIRYLIFGVLTTVVGWVTYFSVLLGGKALFFLPPEDTTSMTYMGIYSVAQLTQWIAAVVFAFWTNKLWVFKDKSSAHSIPKQFGMFASARVLTFFVDYGVTFFGALALSKAIPALNSFVIFGKEINLNEMAAKLIAAVIVVVSNYFFSKLFVFRKDAKSGKQQTK